jgi:6-phosphogluconolactonase
MAQPVRAEAHVHRDEETAALAAAARFVEIGQGAIDERGQFCVALAGGTTPARMYEILAEARGRTLDWGRVHVFFDDERCVRPDHPSSNYATVRRCLLDRIEAEQRRVHRIEGELQPPECAAERYESLLRTFFGAADAGPPEASTFDLVLLGVGEDGHTASLFPGSRAVAEKQRWAVHTRAPQGVTVPDRITLTLPVINAARCGMFLVTGGNKSRVVRPLLAGLGDPGWPAAMIQCAGGVEWHVDEAAAGVVDSIRAHKSNS